MSEGKEVMVLLWEEEAHRRGVEGIGFVVRRAQWGGGVVMLVKSGARESVRRSGISRARPVEH